MTVADVNGDGRVDLTGWTWMLLDIAVLAGFAVLVGLFWLAVDYGTEYAAPLLPYSLQVKLGESVFDELGRRFPGQGARFTILLPASARPVVPEVVQPATVVRRQRPRGFLASFQRL